MKNSLTFCIILLGALTASFSQEKLDPRQFPEPLSPRTASYDMDIYLDTDNRQVRASQTLTFINPSQDTIWNMRFHMYYNAWKNNKTAFFLGSARIPRSKPQNEIDDCIWSWVEVTKAVDEQGNDISDRLRYVQPDDDNVNDHTVLDMALVEPILPGATYQLFMEWHAQIPPLMIRTGYAKDYYFMAQWFPKLGVYEPEGMRFATKGDWNCHQYHPNTEYYGEFGVYDVKLNVPSDYIVGASGFLLDKLEKDGRTTHRYLAEDVIDFTWTAHPGFEVIEDQWRETAIRLLIRPEHVCNKERFLKAAKLTLDYFADYLEPYPYPTLTIVSPPFFGLNSGAMEYPTLFTAPTLCNLPEEIKTTETLTIHEMTHQYFMQMLATNEQEEPWMDEGFTSYFEAKIMDKYYPEGTVSWPYMGWNIGSEELRRGRFFNAENITVNPISDYGFHCRHGSYSQIVYGKTATWLRTLEGLVGEECMQQIIRTYFQRWKFKHPGRQAFIDVVNEVVIDCHGDRFGPDMNWFLEPGIFGTEECDYAVRGITNKEIATPVGFFDDVENCLRDTSRTNQLFEAKAVVFRLGEVIMPQVVEITFDDGSSVREDWDGKARSYEWVYRGSRRIVSVQIDPDNLIPLDRNLLNNSFSDQPDKTGITRFFAGVVSWLESAFIHLSIFV